MAGSSLLLKTISVYVLVGTGNIQMGMLTRVTHLYHSRKMPSVQFNLKCFKSVILNALLIHSAWKKSFKKSVIYKILFIYMVTEKLIRIVPKASPEQFSVCDKYKFPLTHEEIAFTLEDNTCMTYWVWRIQACSYTEPSPLVVASLLQEATLDIIKKET